MSGMRGGGERKGKRKRKREWGGKERQMHPLCIIPVFLTSSSFATRISSMFRLH